MYTQTIRGKSPKYGASCYFAPNATVVGDVTLGADCSVWFQAVIRGDVNSIVMGDRVNVQDGVVIHATFETCLLYTSPSPRDLSTSRMPSSA